MSIGPNISIVFIIFAANKICLLIRQMLSC